MVNPFDSLWVDDGTGRKINPALSADDAASIQAQMQATNIQALWQTATDYEMAQISGSAIGLVTLGVIQSKPKCMAVMGWIKTIWDLYYQRKPTVTYEWDQTLYDFSSCGQMPHTVPELMVELGMS